MSQNARILMVDDEASIRLTLSAMLTRAGYDVMSAGDGEEAVALLERQAFDLLLVDLKMPEMGGVQVVAAARQCQPDIAVIVLTGHGSLDTAIEGIHQDVFDYLLKTSEPSYVVERVKAALAAREKTRRQRTLLNVVGSAIQELRGSQSSEANQPVVEGERQITVGALQLDTWRQEAKLGGPHAHAYANRVPRAALPGRGRREYALLRSARTLRPGL